MKLVFKDWLGPDGQSIYDTQEGIELFITEYHAGTVFAFEELEKDKEWLQKQIEKGHRPVFYLDKD